MKTKLNDAIKTALSPRFVPNDIFQVKEIPRTLTGKKQELPIKKLMLGQPIEKVVNIDAMANPACLDWYVQLAKATFGKTNSTGLTQAARAFTQHPRAHHDPQTTRVATRV